MTTRGRVFLVSTLFTLIVILSNFFSIFSELNTEWGKLILSICLAVTLSLLTTWVLFFKSKNRSLAVISIYPGATIMPVLLAYEDISGRLTNGVGQQLTSLIGIGIIFVVTYLILLTANVLNGYQLYRIPLGMAGKATQFVTTLISTYIFTTYLYSIEEFNYVKALLVSIYVFTNVYVLLWCTWENKQRVGQLTLIASILIAIVLLALTIWPLRPVWVSLVITIVLYLILNTALDLKERITRLVVLEYITLGLICLFVLLVNAEWGINGLLL